MNLPKNVLFLLNVLMVRYREVVSDQFNVATSVRVGVVDRNGTLNYIIINMLRHTSLVM
jgi:hypothetical protein